jgi:hypothetical protein
MRAARTILMAVAAMLAAAPAAAVEDLANFGLREDGGMPLAALKLTLPRTTVIVQAPVAVVGAHSIEVKRELAPNISLGATYRYTIEEEHLHSDRFGLQLTVRR